MDNSNTVLSNAEEDYIAGRTLLVDHSSKENLKKAAFLLLKSARKGNADAQYQLGMMYAKGEGVKKNWRKAIRWNFKAVEQENEEAENGLGTLIESIIDDLKESALNGDVNAQLDLGEIYTTGEYYKENDEEAFNWYLLAAKQGNSLAQYYIGQMYQTGSGTERNDKLAFRWYLKSARSGYVNAQIAVARIYLKGFGIKKDGYEALDWLLKVTEHNDRFTQSEAQCEIARMYFEGDGIEKNRYESFEWYIKASKNQSMSARFALEKKFGIKFNFQLGDFDELELNNIRKQMLTEQGDVYYTGNGAVQDFKKAAECYHKALILYREE